VVALAVVSAAVAAGGAFAVTGGSTSAATRVGACTSGQIGFMGPITGPAASLGKEQLNWARFAIAGLDRANSTHFTVLQGDTQLNPKLALSVAKKFAANKSLLATVGPAGSQEAMTVGPVFARAALPYVSSLATHVPLAQGKYPTLSRVVGSDEAQGRSDALFMVNRLHARNVVVIDDQEAYSTRLAASVTAVLKANGVKVQRMSISQVVTNFSSLAAKIADDTDVVFLPWQVAANGQLFANEMVKQGSSAKIFGSDGLDSAEFTVAGSYVSSFARDIHGLPGTKPIIAAYERKYGTHWSMFGPPTYVAAQVIATAYKAACDDGAATRAELLRNIRAVRLPHSILGIPISFDKHGDVPAAKFYISVIDSDGSRRLVG
jgi:branched-chain amino acid transport system substrate-binding protein